MSKVNVNGGAIAVGHPLGCSGARLMATLLNELERSGGRYGLQTMCEGGGMANATSIERLGEPDAECARRLGARGFAARRCASRWLCARWGVGRGSREPRVR